MKDSLYVPKLPLSILKKARRDVTERGVVSGRRLEISRDAARVHLAGQLNDDGITVEGLVIRLRDTPRELVVANTEAPGFAFDLDLDELWQWVGAVESTLDFFITAYKPGWGLPKQRNQRDPERDTWRLGNFDATERSDAYGTHDLDELAASIVVSRAGNWSIRFGPEARPDIRAYTNHMATRRDGIVFDSSVATGNVRLADVVLIAAGRESGGQIELPLRWEPDEDKTGRQNGIAQYRIRCKVPFSDLPPHGSTPDETVDLFYEFRPLDGAPVLRRGVVVPRLLHRLRLRDGYSIGDERATSFAPYTTAKAEQVALKVEHYSTSDLRYLRRLLRIAPLFFLIRPFTQIWLIGEQPYKAQDNGYQFFRWVRTTHPKRRAYYVIDADSPDRAQVAEFGNVIDRYSRRHILYTLLASRFISSHHAEFLFASRSRRVLRWSRGVRIFLQHGVMGVKQMSHLYGRRASGFRTDHFLVSSELEAKMIADDFGFHRRQIHVTGLARFDRLFDTDIKPDLSVLVIPTWRDWLMHEQVFLESAYLEQWSTFLAHPGLHDLIDNHGLHVRFLLHPNMRKYTEHFERPGVEVLRVGEVNVQDLMKQSAAMVTDYSSVGFDFSFLERPLFYFQFDRAQFIGRHTSHLDLDAQLPGEIGFTADSVIKRLRRSFDGGFVAGDEVKRRSRLFQTHHDQHNNERIYALASRFSSPWVPVLRIRDSDWGGRLYNRFRQSSIYVRSMRLLFAIARQLPRKNIVVFESGLGLQYGDSPRYIYERLLERDTTLDYVWINNTTVRLPDPHTEKVRRVTPRYFWLLGRAKYWVNNQNFPHYLKPSRNTRYLQTWHGTPLKRMQHDMENVTGRADGYIERVTRMTGYWDGLISPSPYATKAFRSAFRYEGEVLETGYPRNDPFHWDDRDERARLVRNRLEIADGRKVILYAPTFRDDSKRGNRFVTELMLDLEDMHRRLGDEYVLLLRFHNIVKNRIKISQELADFVIDASNYPDAQELLLLSDVLITDYSSIMFDFAALDRPMLFFTYDIEHYRDNLRGFYLDFEQAAPGPLLKTSAEVVDALLDLDGVSRTYAGKMAAFRSDFGPLDNGHASDRVIDRFFADDLR